MKVAISLFGERVSPRFDYAEKFLIVDIAGDKITHREIVPSGEPFPLTRVSMLCNLGVGTLICGGIDRFSARQFEYHGITIYAWITGEAEDALQGFLKGELQPGSMMGLGGRCKGRWRFKYGKGHVSNYDKLLNRNEEVNNMPRRDGTGPGGKGPGTGRGLGPCGGGQKGQSGQRGGQGGGRGSGQGGKGAGRKGGQSQ